MGRNLLYCKGCANLCSRNTISPDSLYCELDKHFKAVDKKEIWVQYSNVCPLKKYLGKADFKLNPVVFSEGE